MKALKNEIIKELSELENRAELGEDVMAEDIYKLSKTLYYLHKVCEIMHETSVNTSQMNQRIL